MTVKTAKHEQIPIETPRPSQTGGEVFGDTYASRNEEISAFSREVILKALISPGEIEEFWNFLQKKRL